MEIEDPAFLSVTGRVNVVKRVDKVKLLHDYLITKFQTRFYPGQELAVDKTMVGFRGSLVPNSICYRSRRNQG